MIFTFLNILEGLEFDIYYELMMLCVLVLLGIILGKLAEKINIPAVTGYIVAGILVGPVFHLVTEEITDGLKIISNIARAIISFFPFKTSSSSRVKNVTSFRVFSIIGI